jgi:hypothetical protein
MGRLPAPINPAVVPDTTDAIPFSGLYQLPNSADAKAFATALRKYYSDANGNGTLLYKFHLHITGGTHLPHRVCFFSTCAPGITFY